MNTEDLVQALQEERQTNERLRHELASAQEVIAQLTTRIERLEGQKAKDSHNSSKPPSSDGLQGPVQKTKSLRGTSGKASGGQPGHPGRTLLMVEDPQSLVTLVPATCERCQQSLERV